MKLRTNYTKNDWYRFGLVWFIHLVLFGGMIVFSMNYFFVPGVEMLGVAGNVMKKDDYSMAKKIGAYLRAELGKKYDPEHLALSLILIAFGTIFGFILVFIRLVSLGWIIPDIICRKLKLYPRMSLVVIKNDKFWFRMRT